MNNSCDILFYGHLSNNKEAVKRCRISTIYVHCHMTKFILYSGQCRIYL